MACLQVKCSNPKCKNFNNVNAKVCKCGTGLNKFSGKTYYIQYTNPEGKKKREAIGPNKEAAEHRLREVLSAIAEGRYIQKSPDAIITFNELADWYLKQPKTRCKNQEKYDRDLRGILKRLRPVFGDKLLKDITPATLEAYKKKRLSEPSGRTPDKLTAPATIVRELAYMRKIFNAGRDSKGVMNYPFKKGVMPKENNVRERVLSEDEYIRLLAASAPHLKPIIKVAYYTAMRQGEILNLTWGQVDLDEGFIKLRPEDTKTSEGRDVPLNRELVEMLRDMRPGIPLPQVPVFTYAGRSVGSIKRAFGTACRQAVIEDFTFHDLRHTAINNWRLQGHDYFRIMAASGHKTMSVFKRYNKVSKEELKALTGEKI
jgi:integrase